VREERRRERGCGVAVTRTSVGHHSLIQTPSARVGSPRANFLYPIFYIQFSTSNFLYPIFYDFSKRFPEGPRTPELHCLDSSEIGEGIYILA